MNRQELLMHTGSIEQIGGIRDFTFNDGKAKGVRAIEINTEKIRFTVLTDRCMDIAQAEFEGESFSWISKTGITNPAYYERDSLPGFLVWKMLGESEYVVGLEPRTINGPVNKK